MNKFLPFFLVSFFYANNNQIVDSSFSFIFDSDSIIVGQDSVGFFEGTLYNLSNNEINIEVARLINFTNENWNSSICIDSICYNQSLDSLNVSIAAGDSTICGVLAWTSGVGSDFIQLKVAESFNINNDILVNITFIAQYDLSIDHEYPNANTIKILSYFPNPFNPSIVFKYKISKSNHVRIGIYNVLGKKVKSLVEEVQEAGNYYTKWDGNNEFNKPLPSGAYFLRMQSGEYYMIKKITLIK
ncbi:MAG: T9SS type A sorting domain-containing protein [Candidatus Neomarinimicrobiota bacterium]